MASSSSGTPRSQKGNFRNWTELPDEITSSILSRLGAIEILESAQKVCMKWRIVFKDPLMWRTIDMRNDGDFDDELPYDVEKMCRHAVDRSRGGLVDINIEYFGTDDLLRYIALRSSGIRRVRIAHCDEITDEGLSKMAKRLSLLHDLDISLCQLSCKSVQVVGRSCPRLTSFKWNKEWFRIWDDDSDDDYDSDGEPRPPAPYNKRDDSDALAIARTMPGLIHLQLFGNKMTDNGLRKILDCCPHLKSLDLRHCFNLSLGGDLELRCIERIKKLWLPNDSTKGYEFAARYDGFCHRWTELPDDITFSILSRLGTVDILENAQKVCMKWRRICKDPRMWHTVDMRNNGDPNLQYSLDRMCRHAVNLSAGNLVDINIESFGEFELLHYITNSSSKIRRLRIVCCYGICDEGLSEVVSKFPMLEDIDFTLCKNITHRSLKLIGRSCPLLKSLKVNNEWHKYPDDWFNDDSDDEFSLNRDEDAIAVAQTMPGLRHLQLFGNQITNEGLKKILDGCPHLESLDLRHCFNLDLGGDLGRTCAERIKKPLLPNDSIAGYEFSPSIDWRNQQLSRHEIPVPHWWDLYGNYDSSD
ncbi:hypothetical protein COP1_036412 [Malus domestica]